MDGGKSCIFALAVLCLYLQLGDAIKCWDCNSLYDPRCADPFDNHTLAMVDCDMLARFRPHLKDYPSTLCRKLVQKVGGKTRYVRDCGWLGDIGADDGRYCIARAGTFEVQVNYCACNKDGCNSANSVHISTSALVVMVATAISGFIILIHNF